MNPNDETIYQAPKMQDGFESEEMSEEVVNKAEDKKTSPKSEKKSGGWAKMAIGGVTGVFMGAAGMYAGKPFLDDAVFGEGHTLADFLEEHGVDIPWLKSGKPQGGDIAQGPEPGEDGTETLGGETSPVEGTTTNVPPTGPAQAGAGFTHTAHVTEGTTIPPIGGPLQVAHVDESLSFADAFAQARAEVGPGGVFHWHGGVFNTYTEAEWDSMSASDKSDFAQHVAPEIHHRLDISEDIVIQPGSESPVENTVIDTGTSDSDEADIVMINDSEPDVQILGVQQTVNDDGSVVNLGFGNVDGDPVILVDMDGPEGNGPDGIFESRVTDYDHDGEPEVVDISDIGITVDAWANEAINGGNSVDGTYNSVHADTISQDELAQGEPDYMNDADTSDIYSA